MRPILAPAFAGCALRGGKALIGAVLRPGMEGDLLFVFQDEICDRRVFRVLVAGGPVPPVQRRRVVGGEMLGQGFEDGVALQADAGFGAELFQGRVVVELRESAAQGLQFCYGGTRPVDKRILFRPRIDPRRYAGC